MTKQGSPIPQSFIVRLLIVSTIFVLAIGVLLYLFPPHGRGTSLVEWAAIVGGGVILASVIGGTIWYQWKAVRDRPAPQTAEIPGAGGLERAAGLFGGVLYAAISIAMPAALAFSFTVRDKLLPCEFNIFLLVGGFVDVT